MKDHLVVTNSNLNTWYINIMFHHLLSSDLKTSLVLIYTWSVVDTYIKTDKIHLPQQGIKVHLPIFPSHVNFPPVFCCCCCCCLLKNPTQTSTLWSLAYSSSTVIYVQLGTALVSIAAAYLIIWTLFLHISLNGKERQQGFTLWLDSLVSNKAHALKKAGQWYPPSAWAPGRMKSVS